MSTDYIALPRKLDTRNCRPDSRVLVLLFFDLVL